MPASEARALEETRHLRRNAGRLGLLFASLGGMIGSGWLFGALNAAKMAGPAALIAWVIGSVAIMLLALVFAELSTMFPRAGAVVVFPKLCFGGLAAQVMSWINFLAYISVPPVEAVAVVTYAGNFRHGLVETSGVLTGAGLALAVGLMVLFIVINLGAIRLVLRINAAITWWKLAVPALTVVALLAARFHGGNFAAPAFAPAGPAGVLAAVSGSGIIFTFLGFRQAIELAGETANPQVDLPFAVIGSIAICLVLYLGLQAAFIGALPDGSLAHGWAHLTFPGVSGPFAGLATGAGLAWLAAALYADAAISPAGTGIIYNTTAARVIYAAADGGMFPRRLANLSAAGVPVASLTLCFFAGLLFLVPLPSWRLLVSYLSSIGVLAYGIGPAVLLSFRRHLPEAEFARPYRLPAAGLIGPLAFIVANFVVFWAGSAVVDHLFGGLAIVFVVYLCWQAATRRGLTHLEWRGAWWLAPYFFGLWLITVLGPAKLTHGSGTLPAWLASALLVVFSLGILRLAEHCALREPEEARRLYAEIHMPIARR